MKDKTKKKKKNKKTWPVILLFLLGVAILLYPTLSDTWNQYRNSKLVQHYTATVKKLDNPRIKQIWDDAALYNKEHTVNTSADVFGKSKETPEHQRYEGLLNPNNDGIMGTLTIPKIKENLVIYHGLGDKALEKGCGHMEGTSLPVGMQGPNGSHVVLAAHRGLPSAKLFTDLDKLKEGDQFFFTILDKHLAYQVDQIRTELPEDAAAYLALEPENDYVTLVTCTPYGVNTHRLLIRGHRIPYEDKKVEEATKMVDKNLKKKILLLGALIALIIVSLIALSSRSKNKKKKQQQAGEN